MSFFIFLLWLILSINHYQPISTTPPQSFYEAPVNHFHLYLWGYYNDLNKNHQTAHDCYETIIRTQGPHYTYAGYARHLFQTQQFQKILSLVPSLDTFFSHDIYTQLIIIKSLEAQGRQAEADKRVIALVHHYPDNPELIYYATAAYVRNSNAAEGLALINRFLQNKPEKLSHFLFYFLKAQIHVQLGEKKEALTCIEKCVELNPYFEQGWLLSALLNELAGKLEQAIAGYQNFLGIVGHDKMVEQQILNLMIKKEQQKLLPFNYSLFDKALEQYHQKKINAALNTLNNYLAINNSNIPARLLKIELLCILGKSSRAIEIVKQWIVQEPDSSHWYYLVYLLALSDEEKKHVDLVLQSLSQRYPHSFLPRFYQAQRALKEKKYIAALEYLETAKKETKDQTIIAHIEYQKATIYFVQNKWPEMHNSLKISYESKKDFAPTHHLYAYYYAREEKDYKKAQYYLDQALAIDRSDLTFLHTQARIWYKQKEYTKAPHLTIHQSSLKLPKMKYVNKLQRKYKEHKERVQV